MANKKDRRLGLLSTPAIAPTAAEAGEDPKAELPGIEVPPSAPDQPQKPFGDEEPKRWHKSCHFSCVPYLFEPVDVYNSAGVLLPAGGAPASPPKWVEVAVFDVPEGKVLRLHKLGFGFGVAASGNVIFRAVVDKTPIGEGLGSFDYLLGALNIADMYVADYNVTGPNRVAIEAYNTSVASKTVFGRLMGFMGPDK